MTTIRLLTPRRGENAEVKCRKMLVVLHLHYVDLAPEMMRYLQAIPVPFDLCVTSSHQEAEAAVCSAPKPENLASMRFVLTPNRGRDIAPWLHALPLEEHLQYDVALKIHGKKSVDDVDRGGDDWRHFLLESLLGSRATATAAIRALAEDPELGSVIPVFPPDVLLAKPHAFRWHKRDFAICRKFLAQRGVAFPERPPATPLFAAGSMFYYRPAALAKLLTTPPAYDEFPPEPLPRVGTLAHAIERLPVFIAQAAGYEVARILPETLLDQTFLRYESALLADAMPVKLTIPEFFAASARSLRWHLLKK